MKIKNTILGFTLLLAVLYGVTFYYISHTKLQHVNIVTINDAAKTVEEEFQKKQSNIQRLGSINEMKYRIVLLDDEDYDSQINQALETQEIIIDLYEKNVIAGKVIFVIGDTAQKQIKNRLLIIISFIIGSVWIILCTTIIFLYHQIIHPFQNMQKFARSVAKGDLDFRLHMNKNNYFGAFTESFDLMRDELKRARQGEYEANISKKELVAELSHDIKTPVSTIKAVCELLEVKWSSDKIATERQQEIETDITGLLDFSREKIDVIYNKADMIDKLISNLFHATLEELEMLKIDAVEEESNVIFKMFKEINHDERIHLLNEVPECLIICDVLRLGQVIDNVVNNSYKYAGTDIDVEFHMDRQDKLLKIKIKDYGDGVDESELPLVCQKFYRGSSDRVKNESGSGLGLYLAKLFVEGMQGTFECYNENGFVVEIGILMA